MNLLKSSTGKRSFKHSNGNTNFLSEYNNDLVTKYTLEKKMEHVVPVAFGLIYM